MNNIYEEYLSTISNLLEKRSQVYPIRDQTYYDLNKAIGKFTMYLIETNDFSNWVPEDEILEITEVFYENPIFICGNMRSGTSLVTQLLDGHENLMVMPGDSHFVNLFFNSSNRDFLDLATHWMKRLINPSGQKPFWFLGKEEKTYRNFLYYLNYFLKNSNNEVFPLVVFSFFGSNPKKSLNVKFWVEKTPHNEIHASKLLKTFPKARFIHIIRNPLANISSIKKTSKSKKREFSAWKSALHTKFLMNKALVNQKEIGKDRYHLLRYEDLVSNPKREMVKICKFLRIEFDELLCIPTVNGEFGTSNTLYRDSKVVGKILNQSKSNKWQSELTEREKTYIVSILWSTAMHFGYNEWKKDDIKKYKIFQYMTLANLWELTKLVRARFLKFIK